MVNFIKERYKNLKPYDSEELKGYINLGANEIFVDFPIELREELINIVKNFSFNRYPDSHCFDLVRAFSEYLLISEKNILAGNGSDELIFLVMQSFLEEGDKIITIDPDFIMYNQYANVLGLNNVKFKSNKDFTIDGYKLLDTIKIEKPKMLILSNPNNPTGKVISKKILLQLLKNKDILVVIDEAYGEFYGESMVQFINDYENLIILRTTSKALGLAALRIGFVLAKEELILEIKKIKAPFNVNAISQQIGTLLLKNQHIIKKNTEKVLKEKEYLQGELNKLNRYLKVSSSYTNFFLVEFKDAKSVCQYLLRNKIITRDFNSHRLLNFLRINVGSREENEKLINCLKKYFKLEK